MGEYARDLGRDDLCSLGGVFRCSKIIVSCGGACLGGDRVASNTLLRAHNALPFAGSGKGSTDCLPTVVFHEKNGKERIRIVGLVQASSGITCTVLHKGY